MSAPWNCAASSFKETFRTLRTLLRSLPHPPAPGQKQLRLAVMNCGAPAPGMNTAVRAAVRIGLDRGHVMLGIANGFKGLIEGEIAGDGLDERQRVGGHGRIGSGHQP